MENGKCMDSVFVRKLIQFALPAAIQQLTATVVRVADTFMLGAIDQTAMAAVSLALEVQNVHSYVVSALIIVTGVFVAQYMGKQNREAVERVFAIGARICGIASLVFVLSALLVPKWLMGLFTNDGNMIDLGAEYLRSSSPVYFFYGIAWIYHSMMKNSGRAVQSAAISSVCIILKLFLNGVFLFGWFELPKMDIYGVALATVVYNGIEMLAVLTDSLPKDRIKLRAAYLISIERCLQKDFSKYLYPVLAEMMSWGVGFTVCMTIIGRLGEDVVAANSLAITVKNVTGSLYMGFQTASGTILGFELGAGNLRKAREYGDKIVKISMCFGFLAAGLCAVSRFMVVAIVDMTAVAAGYLPWIFAMCAICMIGQSCNAIVNGGILSAGGDSKFSFWCDTISMWGVVIPCGMLAAFFFELPVLVVCFIIYADDLIKLPWVVKRYRKYKWVRNLTADR